jgi:glutamate dehydrogenase/leucine dehydrogenase
MKYDELGPEVVLQVHDPATGMRGILSIDSTVNGPAGGGTRMVPDLSVQEVMDLSRAMTYKWGIFGFPSGGSKAGIIGDSNMPAEQKKAVLRAFGRALRPMLASQAEGVLLGVGPDMGITGADTDEIYAGAELPNCCPTLYTWSIDSDPASYHMTGRGVIAASKAALESIGRKMNDSTIAIEGFGQAGVGTARYAIAEGARVVAITTIQGGLHDPKGLDIPRLLELRRQHGDACVHHYGSGERIAPQDLFGIACDVVVPGARPREIDAFNEARVRAKIVCPAGNLCVTEEAEDRLHARGVLVVPDFVANGGGIIVTWVDMLGGNAQQGLSVVERLIRETATSVLDEAKRLNKPAPKAARGRVRDKIIAAPRRRTPYAEAREKAAAIAKLPAL